MAGLGPPFWYMKCRGAFHFTLVIPGVPIVRTPNIHAFVIPGLTRNPGISNSLRDWMPDQVRHDRQKLNAFFELRHTLEGGNPDVLCWLYWVHAPFCTGAGSTRA
jgi:hypothetical protein